MIINASISIRKSKNKVRKVTTINETMVTVENIPVWFSDMRLHPDYNLRDNKLVLVVNLLE